MARYDYGWSASACIDNSISVNYIIKKNDVLLESGFQRINCDQDPLNVSIAKFPYNSVQDYAYSNGTLINTPSNPVFHNICQNNTCIQIDGQGTNECESIGQVCNMIITQDENNVYVSVAGITTPGRIVTYDPGSIEIYRNPTMKTGSWIDTLPKTLFTTSGLYYFWLYDASDVVVQNQTATLDYTINVIHHNICQNNVCTEVTGSGTNECQNINQTCPTPPVYHNVCQNNICTKIEGTGTDECTNLNAACPVTPTTNNTAIILIAALAAGFLIFRRK